MAMGATGRSCACFVNGADTPRQFGAHAAPTFSVRRRKVSSMARPRVTQAFASCNTQHVPRIPCSCGPGGCGRQRDPRCITIQATPPCVLSNHSLFGISIDSSTFNGCPILIPVVCVTCPSLLCLYFDQFMFSGYHVIGKVALNEHTNALVFSFYRDLCCTPLMLIVTWYFDGWPGVPWNNAPRLAFLGAQSLLFCCIRWCCRCCS